MTHIHVFQEWDILKESTAKEFENKHEKITNIQSTERPAFGFLIQQARLKKRMTTKDVAESANLTPKLICLYENGTEIPSATISNILKRVLDID